MQPHPTSARKDVRVGYLTLQATHVVGVGHEYFPPACFHGDPGRDELLILGCPGAGGVRIHDGKRRLEGGAEITVAGVIGGPCAGGLIAGVIPPVYDLPVLGMPWSKRSSSKVIGGANQAIQVMFRFRGPIVMSGEVPEQSPSQRTKIEPGAGEALSET